MPHLALLFCLALAPVWRVYLIQTPGPPRVVFTGEPSPALLVPTACRGDALPGDARAPRREVRYAAGPCSDAVLLREIFSETGLLLEQHAALLIGPASARLVYAPGHATRDLRFEMRIEPLDTTRRLRLTLMLTNNAAPFALQFPSGQDYDLVLRDEAGREALRWSTDRMFTMVFRTIPVAKGELRWTADWPLPPSLPPGQYTLEASLATQPGPIFIAAAPIAF